MKENTMKMLNVSDRVRYQTMTTEELRKNFFLSLFAPGNLELVYTDVDRAIIGSAVPTGKPLLLTAATELRAEYFLERRELGVINIGAPGKVTVDGKAYELGARDGLYIGRGSRSVSFESASAADPAAFYLLSYPAHMTYPTTSAKKADAEAVKLGDQFSCNRRTIYKYIHPRGIRSCQLVMGFTEIEDGSAWNTMPTHTHDRRSEIYLYFGLKPEVRIIHLMGSPQETRHLVLSDREIAISPSWSIHSGVGTGAYTFCWGMGGENQAFEDMDPVGMSELR